MGYYLDKTQNVPIRNHQIIRSNYKRFATNAKQRKNFQCENVNLKIETRIY